ncbi:hypothetical protein LPB19_13475 [Marinobacter salinisoli]|uniref:Uncharacterized protein n=1 Tax=Marinobacter salinisoli TaxID=2769486 RepID=A0ABX7MPE9_9GAMM|nr:hypothetical protein [Marinobacter salinisoli]QSP94191.1 hypothetical protein LPB19_13475 [Marinobacter salinisoli]
MPTPYNMAFACLSCCKSFKREFNLAKECPAKLTCPDCGGAAHNFGRDFKAPKRSDKRQWDKIRFLFDHGFRFQKIRVGSGHHDVVPYPETMDEAREFVVKYKKYAAHVD